MSTAFRRYEILLPLRFNDGQPVPYELVGETLVELRTEFGAVSWESQIIRGQWQHQDQVYRDKLVRVFVDIPDKPKHRQFFRKYKKRLQERFKQIDIWMITHPVERL